MRKRVIAAGVILFGLISSGWARDTRFLNLSMVHRGDGVLVPGRVNRPDNSLEACLHAWSCDVVPEADIRRTKDGVIIAYHNSTYKRRKIEEYDWAELRDVSIGAAHGAEWDHVRIPPSARRTAPYGTMCASPRGKGFSPR